MSIDILIQKDMMHPSMGKIMSENTNFRILKKQCPELIESNCKNLAANSIMESISIGNKIYTILFMLPFYNTIIDS